LVVVGGCSGFWFSRDCGCPRWQVLSEVQSLDEVLRVESRETRRAAIRCALPLLRPSPNSAHDDAQGNDKLVLQPGLDSRHFYLEMLHFLGQVLGMAVRSKARADQKGGESFESLKWQEF
jgi:hypothetical protein